MSRVRVSEMTRTMRAFVAIDLPDYARDAITDLQAALPAGQPVPAENLHLTLAFLGEQPEEMIEEAHIGLQRIGAPDFELKLTGLDTFGGSAPRVLFVGVERNEALVRLSKMVRSAMHGAGLQIDRKRFRPHVTLARFRPGMSDYDIWKLQRFLSDRGGLSQEPFRVTSFALYRSTLRPEGAVHEKLAEYGLG